MDTYTLPLEWDIETDVLVVGFGFAGGVAAVAAADCGGPKSP